MELTKKEYIILRLLMFDLFLTDLSEEKVELVFVIQSTIDKKLKEIGAYSDELILPRTRFRIISPPLKNQLFPVRVKL